MARLRFTVAADKLGPVEVCDCFVGRRPRSRKHRAAPFAGSTETFSETFTEACSAH